MAFHHGMQKATTYPEDKSSPFLVVIYHLLLLQGRTNYLTQQQLLTQSQCLEDSRPDPAEWTPPIQV